MKKSLLILGTALAINTNAQVVTTLAGSTTAGSADGTGAAASFYYPAGVAADGSGNLYVADAGNNEIRKIVIATGVVTTLAGSTTSGFADGTGAAASFNQPTGVAADGSGNLYVVDYGNNEIRKIVIATGVVSTLAGSTTTGSADGTGAAARFNRPVGVAADGSGNLYVADGNNNEIRKIVIATGVVSTLAGNKTGGSADGTGAAASFKFPTGVAADASGNLYVTDYQNYEIRKIVIATGVVTTLAGSTTSGFANGIGAAASFNLSKGVAADGSGNLYVTDYGNNEIRKIVIATGVVSTLAGNNLTAGSANGTGAAASFNQPAGIAADASGNLYVGDFSNNEIRKIVNGTTGINELAGSNEVNIYPNPSNGSFVIQTNATTKQTVLVYDINGKVVLSQTINGKTNIDASSLANGIYNLSIASNEGIANKRLVIVR